MQTHPAPKGSYSKMIFSCILFLFTHINKQSFWGWKLDITENHYVKQPDRVSTEKQLLGLSYPCFLFVKVLFNGVAASLWKNWLFPSHGPQKLVKKSTASASNLNLCYEELEKYTSFAGTLRVCKSKTDKGYLSKGVKDLVSPELYHRTVDCLCVRITE